MTPSCCKAIVSFVSSLHARCAVYDEELNRLWTNCNDYFDKFDLSIVQAVLPVKNETPITADDGDAKSVLTIVPVYRSKRVVCGYVLILRDVYDILRMTNCTSIDEFSKFFLREGQETLGNIISVNQAIRMTLKGSKHEASAAEVLKRQYDDAIMLFNDLSRNMALLAVKAELPITVNCNVTSLVDSLCTETSGVLAYTKRKLAANLDKKSYYAKINYNIFSISFACLLHSQLSISLPGIINISSTCKDDIYMLSIRTQADPDISDDTETKSKNERELAHKIIAGDCGCGFEFTADEESLVSTISLPITKKNRGMALNMKNAEYISGAYQSMRIFLFDIAQKEYDEKIARKMKKSEKAGVAEYLLPQRLVVEEPAAKKAPAKKTASGKATAKKAASGKAPTKKTAAKKTGKKSSSDKKQ